MWCKIFITAMIAVTVSAIPTDTTASSNLETEEQSQFYDLMSGLTESYLNALQQKTTYMHLSDSDSSDGLDGKTVLIINNTNSTGSVGGSWLHQKIKNKYTTTSTIAAATTAATPAAAPATNG